MCESVCMTTVCMGVCMNMFSEFMCECMCMSVGAFMYGHVDMDVCIKMRV